MFVVSILPPILDTCNQTGPAARILRMCVVVGTASNTQILENPLLIDTAPFAETEEKPCITSYGYLVTILMRYSMNLSTFVCGHFLLIALLLCGARFVHASPRIRSGRHDASDNTFEKERSLQQQTFDEVNFLEPNLTFEEQCFNWNGNTEVATDFDINQDGSVILSQTHVPSRTGAGALQRDVRMFQFGLTEFHLVGNPLAFRHHPNLYQYRRTRRVACNAECTRVAFGRTLSSNKVFVEIWDLDGIEWLPSAGGGVTEQGWAEFGLQAFPVDDDDNERGQIALSDTGKRILYTRTVEEDSDTLDIHDEGTLGQWTLTFRVTMIRKAVMAASNDGNRVAVGKNTVDFKGIEIYDYVGSTWTMTSRFDSFLPDLPSTPTFDYGAEYQDYTRIRLSGDGTTLVFPFRLFYTFARFYVYKDNQDGTWSLLGIPLAVVQLVSSQLSPTFYQIQAAALNHDGMRLAVVYATVESSGGSTNRLLVLDWNGMDWNTIVGDTNIELGVNYETEDFRIEFTLDSSCLVVNTGSGEGPVRRYCGYGSVGPVSFISYHSG